MKARFESEFSDIDHFIWDFNGTLIHDVDLCVNSVNVVLEHFKLPELSKAAYRKSFRFPVRDFYAELGLAMEPAQEHRASELFHKAFHAGLGEVQTPNGLIPLLEHLREQQKTLSVLSAAHEGDLHSMLTRFGIRDFFHHAFGLEDRKARSKIERGQDLMALVGSAPERTLLIGDTDHDIEVARALGVQIALVADDGHQCPTRLVEHGVKLLSW